MMKTKIMINTDSPMCGTGFSEEMRHVAYRLAQTNKYEIYWNGYNYVGFDLDLPDKIFPDLPQIGATIKCLSGTGPSQLYGYSGFKRNFNRFAPDLLLGVGDPKNFEPFVRERKKPDSVIYPYMVYTTLDGLPIDKSWTKEIFPYINVSMTMTEWAMREYHKVGINIGGYIHHGVNWNWFFVNEAEKYKIRRNYGISDDTTIFISWETNQHRKRIDALLRCWKNMKPETKKAKLFLYADSDCFLGWDLEKLMDSIGVPRETVLLPEDLYGRRKYFEQAEPLEFHKAISSIGDIYLSCTSGEGFGKCPLEAMSLGMPVIITDYSACSEVCSNGSILVPTYSGQMGRFRWHDTVRIVEGGIVNEEKFTEAMLRLYDNPSERKELGIRARQWARNFDYDTQILPAWLDVLDRINPDTILAQEVLRT